MANLPFTRHERQIPLCYTDLPFSIRRKIYITAGLTRVCPISLNTEGGNKAEYLQECKEWCLESTPQVRDLNMQASMRCSYRCKRFSNQAINISPDGFNCMCVRVPHTLLRISRAIHKEVLSILYSENKFRIARNNYGGLSPLLTLSSTALHSMTSLTIRLNSCSCIPGHQCPDQRSFEKQCPECHDTCDWGGDIAFSIAQPNSAALISEWKQVSERLALFIKPGKLKLNVVCDTLDYVTAKQITDPLLKLPRLAECYIRLGQAPDHTLRSLAHETVYQLTGQAIHNPNQVFNFSALPIELQIHVLGYTDLISPVKLGWNNRGLEWPSCCLRCTDALEACCCFGLHAAYSSLSSHSSDCWTLPSALFLVSKTVRNQSMEIFFSQNIFQTRPDALKSLDSQHTLDFLRALPSLALQHLRMLEFIFKGLHDYPFGPLTEFDRNWNATIEFISKSLNLPELCLRIEDHGANGSYSDEGEEQEWSNYQNLTMPLVKLRGRLKDFSIRFAPAKKNRPLRRDREVILKKRVMGDAYHEITKYEPTKWDRIRQAEAKKKIHDRERVFGPDGTQIWPLGPAYIGYCDELN